MQALLLCAQVPVYSSHMKLTLLIVPFLAAVAFAQTLSPSATTVPATFKGSDAKAIAASLLVGPLRKPKDEFESTAAYEKRITNAEAVTLPDGSSASAQLVFKLTDLQGGSDGSGAYYDADMETLTLKLDVTAVSNYSDTIKAGARTVLLATPDFQDLGTYVGQNAFGVKREISRSKLTNYRLVINNELAFPQSEKMGYGYTPIHVSIKLPVVTARQAKDAFGILYFVKLARPYLSVSFFDKKPEIDSPSEVKSTTYFIYADVLEIWMFNSVTGQIYKKIKAGDPAPAKPADIIY